MGAPPAESYSIVNVNGGKVNVNGGEVNVNGYRLAAAPARLIL